MISNYINKKSLSGLFTFGLLLFAVYVLYSSYRVYQFHTHERHLRNIHITVEFIPKSLCGTEFDKDEITIEEDIKKYRDHRLKLNLPVAMQDYYLGYTVVNKSSKSISSFVIETDILFPYDRKANPFSHPIQSSILFEPKNEKKLEPGQYMRRCKPKLLDRDYSDSELLKSRRISKVDWIRW